MKNELTYEELHKQLMYNPWTGYFYWKVSRPGVKYGTIAGSKNHGYIDIGINKKVYQAHRLTWLYVHGYMSENMIDHKDRIRYHNWIKNLREATNQCNQRNTGNRKDNTSGVKGVRWEESRGKWMAFIRVKKHIFLGYYDDFDEAVCTRLACEQCVDWEDCNSSSPAYLYVKNNIQWWME